MGVTVFSIDSFNILLSSKVKPTSLSIIIKASEALSSDLSDHEDEYLSICFFLFFLGTHDVWLSLYFL